MLLLRPAGGPDGFAPLPDPVRTGEHVLLALAAVPSAAAVGVVESRIAEAEKHAAAFRESLARPPERMRLQPTARSLLP